MTYTVNTEEKKIFIHSDPQKYKNHIKSLKKVFKNYEFVDQSYLHLPLNEMATDNFETIWRTTSISPSTFKVPHYYGTNDVVGSGTPVGTTDSVTVTIESDAIAQDTTITTTASDIAEVHRINYLTSLVKKVF